MSAIAPQPLITPDEARRLVLEHSPVGRSARLPLSDAGGLILAETVRADRDYPPFPRAMMDGFGVRIGDAGKAVSVVAEAPAGRACNARIGDGQAVRIMTGAPVPWGVEAIVPVEDADCEDGRVLLPAEIAMGKNIAPKGSECAQGRIVLDRGTPLGALEIAALASFGVNEPEVWPAPSVAVIVTGDEIVAPAMEQPAAWQIRDANGPMIQALLRRCGVRDARLFYARDTQQSLVEALGASEAADIVLLAGGVSAGDYDLVPGTLADRGATLVFHKVAQKPGKPLLFAHDGPRLMFGLPGNPLGALVGFQRCVAPAIRRWMGAGPPPPPFKARVTAPCRADSKRTVFAVAACRFVDDEWSAEPLKCKGSADVFSAQKANALIRMDPGQDLGAGAWAFAEWLDIAATSTILG